MQVVTPVFDDKQHLFGFLALKVNIGRYLRQILLNATSSYNVILFDNYGDYFVLDHKNKHLRYISSRATIKDGLFGDKSIKDTKGIHKYLEQSNNRITLFRPIYANRENDQQVLTIAISLKKSFLRSIDKPITNHVAIWVFAICLLAALAIFLFTKWNMQQLRKMIKIINHAPPYSDKPLGLPIKRKDEIGSLARAFEQKAKLLNKLALYDSLTGLPNRKSFIDMLDRYTQAAKRNNTLIAIVFLDINKFKNINDEYGHDYGDELLLQVANVLQTTKTDKEFCARLGGDEFVLIITDASKKDDLLNRINHYQDNLNKNYTIKGVTINVKTAGGIAIYPDDTTETDELLQLADKAMYRVKKSGKAKFIHCRDFD
jgi:diguanylate cyclase (GGDEF)-like protein